MILARFTIDNTAAVGINSFSSKPCIDLEPKEFFRFVVRMPIVGELRSYPGLNGSFMVTSAKNTRYFRLEVTLKHEVFNQ